MPKQVAKRTPKNDEDGRVRWGIIGCGSIATNAIAPAIRWSSNGRMFAVASRAGESSLLKAREVSAERAHDSYQSLLEDPEVDAVYIGLPNGLHEEWSIKSAQAGKSVLCEKSLALSGESARRMVAEFQKRTLVLMEAYMYRHHPQWEAVRRLIDSGSIGEVRLIQATLTVDLRDSHDHRWTRGLGGGALYDVTCYGVNVARFLLAREPLRATAMADTRTVERVDRASTAILEFPGGVLAQIMGSLRGFNDQVVTIIGTEGKIEVTRPFVPGWERCEIIHSAGIHRDVHEVAGANHFLHQVEHFAEAVRDPDHELPPGEDGLRNTLVLEAIEQSWISGKTIEVPEP